MVTKPILLTLAAVLVFHSDGLSQTKADSAANRLTKEEKRARWKLLFDGKTWTNWTLSKERASSYWKIEDGWIRTIPRGTTDEGWRLATLESFRDFELQFEWKIGKEGNSGVKYRLQGAFKDSDVKTGHTVVLPPTFAALKDAYPLGFEYQLTDDENAPDALDSPTRSTAALYRIVAPRKPRPVVAGTLHTSRIKLAGDHFEHWLDGERVAEGDLRSEALRAVLEKNRAAGVKKFETSKDDHGKYNGLLERVTAESLLRLDNDESPIELQHHRSAVWFRNIKIRRLSK